VHVKEVLTFHMPVKTSKVLVINMIAG